MGGVLGAKSDCQKEVSDGSPDVRRRGPRPSRRERWALSPPVPSSATAASGNPWAAYRPGAAGAVAGEADVHGDPGRYISYRLRERVRRLGLEGAELAALGALRFSDQFLRVEEMEAVAGLSGRGPLAGGGGAGFRRPPPPNGRDSAVAPGSYSGGYGWVDDDEEMEEDKFWWHGETERLCFDLPITEEEYLTEGAPEIQQWWDVSKVAESEHYIAVAKPAGMFVVTDERGLWEESPTNFVHVTHRRFDIATKNEPRQRGICHRLDSHTSGIQIVGKSWESFRHFMAKNTRHKVQKEYIALVEGKLGHGGAPCPDDPGFGLVDVPMWKYQDQTRREFGSVFCASQGLPAVTKYRALRQWRVPATGALKFWVRAVIVLSGSRWACSRSWIAYGGKSICEHRRGFTSVSLRVQLALARCCRAIATSRGSLRRRAGRNERDAVFSETAVDAHVGRGGARCPLEAKGEPEVVIVQRCFCSCSEHWCLVSASWIFLSAARGGRSISTARRQQQRRRAGRWSSWRCCWSRCGKIRLAPGAGRFLRASAGYKR
eukprot:TRINITY_DN28159_c0_g1_i7.p1 TRINITY_DN28159_c0_g1~~TRINITY_DN28159_c0_g1_i7.p1  ORF type:complete len:546 (-),score=89.32 TRINITY_DN28159_c0_g1_i7:278-1915(-)